MKKETLYLDTSVVSAYCDDRTIEWQQATVKFWEEVLPHYKIFISEVTVNELENTMVKVLSMIQSGEPIPKTA